MQCELKRKYGVRRNGGEEINEKSEGDNVVTAKNQVDAFLAPIFGPDAHTYKDS